MPTDPTGPTGTAPGLASQEPPKPEPVNIRCKNPDCDSILAYAFTLPDRPGIRMYRCIKCGATKGVNVGGSVDL